jgi:hypothetical protein
VGIPRYEHSIAPFVGTIREEIRLIQNQELFYRKLQHHTFEQITAHTRRESRLLQIRQELQKLRK